MKSKILFLSSTLILVSILSIFSVNAFTTDDCIATGGSVAVVGNRCIHTFLTNNSFVPSGTMNVSVLVIAGGGGGGDNTGTGSGGGGGAGGFIFNNSYIISGSTNVIVGNAGLRVLGQRGSNGGNSTFGLLNSKGGGGGGSFSFETGNASDGGSGGGVGQDSSGHFGLAFDGQGNNGSLGATGCGGGGGGGSGTMGTDCGSGSFGGNGTQNNITGTLTYYAGGGGGGNVEAGTKRTGGLGGGGNGANGGIQVCTVGTDGLGGGGGGGQGANGGASIGCDGGSGVVIISYQIDEVNENFSATFNVTLDSPSNNFISTINNVDFDCDIEDSPQLLNLTLIIDGVPNQTITNSTGNQTDLELTATLPFVDGTTHNWTCQGFSKTWNNTAPIQTFSIQIPVNPPSVQDNVIFQLLNSTGAGLGIFIQLLAIALPVLLILIGIVGVIFIIGTSIAEVLKGNFLRGRK